MDNQDTNHKNSSISWKADWKRASCHYERGKYHVRDHGAEWNPPWNKEKKGMWNYFKTRFWKGIWQSWAFFMDCLKIRRFNEVWCGWIKQVLSGGTISIKLNDQIGPYFTSHKGVRLGDPLSPIHPFYSTLLRTVWPKWSRELKWTSCSLDWQVISFPMG